MSRNPPPRTLSAAVRRGALLSAACPSREVLKHVTSRWGVLLLMVLMGAPEAGQRPAHPPKGAGKAARPDLPDGGAHRFSALHRKIGGVSEKMLAQTLRWLEDDGFVVRTAYPTVPPHVEYGLTPLGREVGQRVEALADWIESSMPLIAAAQRAPAAADVPPGRVIVRAGRVVASRARAPRRPASRPG